MACRKLDAVQQTQPCRHGQLLLAPLVNIQDFQPTARRGVHSATGQHIANALDSRTVWQAMVVNLDPPKIYHNIVCLMSVHRPAPDSGRDERGDARNTV